jgi:glycosyltransferase involved in cell wall biosynthesis
VIARALVMALREAGHQADMVVTPQNRFGRNVSTYVANRLTDVGRTADGQLVDAVISLRWPSYAVRHPVHVSWLNHTAREYYDLWDRFTEPLGRAAMVKEFVRRTIIRRADTWLLRHNVSRLFAQSQTVRDRLARYNGLRAEVLYPPAPPRPYRCDAYEPFVFAVSRLSPLKRLDLLIEALARPEAAGVRAVIAGDGECRDAIQALVGARGLERRVDLVGRVSEPQLLDYLARCRAVVFVPRDEDYGFVTVEAFASRKAVITTTDSGGPAELVRGGESGAVVEPTPAALATAMQRLMDDEAAAERMGAAGERAGAKLTWPATVARLLH